MSLPYCSDKIPHWCENNKGDIDSACHEEGKEAGKHIMWHPEKGLTCWCVCSCLGAGTPITLADNSSIPIEAVKVNETIVRAAGLDLEFKPTLIQEVSAAAPGVTNNTIYLKYRVKGSPRQLVLTSEHPVVVEKGRGDWRVIAAANLQVVDQLVDCDREPVAIDEIRWGSYEGSFWELATSMQPPNAKMDGHLLLTGGVVTGDFAVTTFVEYPFGLGSTDRTADRERPLIGTAEWLASNPYAPVDAPIDVNGSEFRPSELHRVAVPEYASAFLPAQQAAALEEPTVPKRPITDAYYLEECEWLLGKVFKPLYPTVTFLFDWYSDTVNAASWVDVEDKRKQYIYLSGGLARVEGFDYEGMALALAHEVGHLRGKPTMRDGVTCEGAADFYGALNVLRMVWFGEYYFEFTTRAVEQLQRLYAYLEPQLVEQELVDRVGDRYPSNACRIETIEAAMSTPRIPTCAECAPRAEATA